MAVFSVHNVALKGVAACVPGNMESNKDYDWISAEDRDLLIKTTGVVNRRVVKEQMFASDMCVAAAEKLFQALNWNPSEVEMIVFVSQSKDYVLPSTATILQHRLGLPKTALAFDVPLGCSGYVYGLSIVASMMNNAGIKKGLLLAGDTSSLSLSWNDKSTYPLFGDAASATALEYTPGSKMDFNLQSDGSGYEAIIIPHGGARQPVFEESDIATEYDKGVIRKKKNLWLNGFDVFNFSVKEVPVSIRYLLEQYGYTVDEIDYFIMHQANLLMNETIRKKLKINPEKVPYSLKDYGNTSSASIPLTMVVNLKEQLANHKNKLLLSGFGVGLSWGSVVLDTENLVIPDIVEL